MSRIVALFVFVFACTSPISSFSSDARASATMAQVWQPPSGLRQIPIWPHGAPDMSGVSQPPESEVIGKSPDLIAGRPVTSIHNVSTPTMTIFRPRKNGDGTAMIVFPGGGFQILAIDLEGTEICDWATSHGMTCIVLKYRVPKSAKYYDSGCKCSITPKIPRALQDAQRTIRLVRARARSLGIDPQKIGVIGFSAGGYLVAETSNITTPVYRPVDAADRQSSRPNFAIASYPGHLWRDASSRLDPDLHVSSQAPPTFLLQAWDDPVDEVTNSIVYARALDAAGVSTEVHLFAKGGHAFGLRRTARPITQWPALVERWLEEIGMNRSHAS